MEQSRLRIQMLGGFSVTYDGRPAFEEVLQSRRMRRLLQYLLLNSGREVTHGELITAMWGDAGDCELKLRALLHRLRVAASKDGPELRDCVVTGRGTYCWNAEMDAEIDVVEFEALAARVTAAQEETQRQALAARLVALYRGRLLPDAAGESWVESRQLELHTAYQDALFYQIAQSKQNDDPAQTEALCRRAIEIDPYDERLYVELILALRKQGNEEAADAVTDEATARGCLHTDAHNRGLDASYRRMQRAGASLERDVKRIVQTVREGDAELGGAFLCSYDTFCSICRVQLRMRMRYDVPLFLVTVCVVPPVTRPSAARTAAAMRVLANVLSSTLRSSDVAARYGEDRFVLLLNGRAIDGKSPMERVRKEFYRRPEHDNYLLTYCLHTPRGGYRPKPRVRTNTEPDKK
ncbi:MAG TPA: diguanylate cyclase [Candidatus Gemmiger avicola]|uniref:Diguanylate cyclase n=1 Tax=Candidatus Gemmiger avicola TaxID=2838605 RepID=A0A9D2M7A1_9FIRM|nr:diguanylate cyclase [Candidatus Gemmiger avicola]